MKPFVTWEECERKYYRAHPERSVLALDLALADALEEGDWPGLLSTIQTIAEVRGGLGKLARQLKCSRTTLYRTLSAKGNPRLATLAAILRALGLRLSIQVAGDAVAAKAPRGAKAAKPRKSTRQPVTPRATTKPRPAKPRSAAAKVRTSVVKAPVKARRVAAKGRRPKP